ncbi:MAG: Ig-like domain-containing protein, partial [Cyanobacteria bacterium J06641_5]
DINEEEEILLNSTADLQILANGATISLPIVNSPEAAVDPTDIPNETESVDFTFTPQGGIELSDTLISVPTNVPLDFTVNSDTEFVETFNFFETIAAFEDFVPDPANTPPVAVDDSATTDEDVAVIIDVLANDSDPDPEDVLSIDTVTEGANGTVTINDDGTLTYTPDTGFSGTDSFTYTISDAEGATSTATVSVTVGLDDIPATPDLDVDGDGDVVAAVDILNIFRVLAGAPQAVVVPDGIAIDQQAIADAVEALPDSALDVDGFGGVTPAVDILNIFRVLAGAPQAVVVTDEASANGATQQTIADAVNDLL